MNFTIRIYKDTFNVYVNIMLFNYINNYNVVKWLEENL